VLYGRAWWEHRTNEAPVAQRGGARDFDLVFYGVTDAGSVLEVRGKKDEELEVRGRCAHGASCAEKDYLGDAPLSFRGDGLRPQEVYRLSRGRSSLATSSRRETAAVDQPSELILRRADDAHFCRDATWGGRGKRSNRPGGGDRCPQARPRSTP